MKDFKTRVLAKVLIFDVGSNIGEYAEIIIHKLNKIKINYEIHLFEPQKACFNVLLKKFQEASNIKLNNFGFSNRNGEATLLYDKETSGLASLYQRNLDYCNIQLDKTERIVLKRLDEYIESDNIDLIHFIKLDIEGHELKALEGLRDYLNDSFIDYIQFEYVGANFEYNTSLIDIYKFIKNRCFLISKIMKNGLEIREYHPFMENFQYSNYVAISKKVLCLKSLIC
jgi:FkbM family methyltransferase